MNERIRQLADHVRDHAPKLIQEAETSILEAIEVAREAANEDDKELIVTIPIGVKWNMDKNKIEVKVSVAVKHNYTSEASLPDPDQPELLDGDGNPMPPHLNKPLRALQSVLKDHGAVADVSFSIPNDAKTRAMLKKAANELEGGAR